MGEEVRVKREADVPVVLKYFPHFPCRSSFSSVSLRVTRKCNRICMSKGRNVLYRRKIKDGAEEEDMT